MTSARRPILDDEEKEALAHIHAYMRTVNEWGLSANRTEMIAAVHALQSFVIQHMLHRVEPAEWSNWYRGSDEADDRGS